MWFCREGGKEAVMSLARELDEGTNLLLPTCIRRMIGKYVGFCEAETCPEVTNKLTEQWTIENQSSLRPHALKGGMRVDARDKTFVWYPSTIMQVDDCKRHVQVTFDHWRLAHAEWIPFDQVPERIAPLDTHAWGAEWSAYTMRGDRVSVSVSNVKIERDSDAGWLPVTDFRCVGCCLGPCALDDSETHTALIMCDRMTDEIFCYRLDGELMAQATIQQPLGSTRFIHVVGDGTVLVYDSHGKSAVLSCVV